MGSENHPPANHAVAGRSPEGVGALGQPFLEMLPITGVSISVMGRAGVQSTIYASNAKSRTAR